MIRFRHIMVALPVAAFTLSSYGSSNALAQDVKYGPDGTVTDDGISYTVPYAGVDAIADSHFFYSGAVVGLAPRPNATSNIVIGGFAGRGEFS
jgi:hypothetical protein